MAGRMNVCVIGATGFIGGAIARAAVERGCQVRAMRRRPGAVGAIGDIADSIEWVPGAIDEAQRLTSAMRGCDMVFHPAGYYPTHYAPLGKHVANAESQIHQVLAAFDTVPQTESPPGTMPTPREAGVPDTLTSREEEVLHLMGEGLTNQEIADELVISLYTVKRHATNIYDKLNVNSRRQAVRAAQHLGIFPSK